MRFAENSAPILIVMGQSNAHAHGTKLPENERIHTPLKNVHGLTREYNQAYGLDDVTWSGFTTSEMNLGETQDDTCCVANYFAKMWQDAIDNGEKLPDLYVIQISIGAQGIAEYEKNGCTMWYPMREKILVPGPLDTCNISLYPLATEILSLAYMNLIANGKRPEVIGLHWNQWETECQTGPAALDIADANYRNLFWGFFTALGSDATGKGIPLYLYRALAEIYDPDDLAHTNRILDGLAATLSDCRIIDLRDTALYNDTPKTHGIFQKDCIHYNSEAQYEFAKRQWADIFR